jgi:hypothetical protein
MPHIVIDPNRKLAIWLRASHAFVLYECLARYQESDPQVLRPDTSEYHALMHVLGQVEKWVEHEAELAPDDYAAAVAEAYEDLSDPAGYRGNEPAGPAPQT